MQPAVSTAEQIKKENKIMTFSDIFKSSFLENITSVSILDMVIALVLAFGIRLYE